MKIDAASKRATRTLAVLLGLTAATLAAVFLLQDAAWKVGLTVAVGFTSICKVRLVVLDFLGLRTSGSALILALQAWAAVVLILAAARPMAAAFALF
jgi:nitric oxide reductase NorF protein